MAWTLNLKLKFRVQTLKTKVRTKIQGPIQGPDPKIQGPDPKIQGPDPKIQGPRRLDPEFERILDPEWTLNGP